MDKQAPFYFKQFDDNKILISNMNKKFMFVNKNEFKMLYENTCQGNFRDQMLNNYFIYEDNNINEIVDHYRQINSVLFKYTFLHIFVLTLECNLDCIYCQAEYNQKSSSHMTKTIAKKAVDIALSSPEKNLTFEFQGGEPLLNFDVLKYIIEYSTEVKGDKTINYSLITNAQIISEKILDYLVDKDVNICISIDGPKELHDINRPSKCKISNYDKAVFWLKKAKEKYRLKNAENKVSALPTITRHSFKFYKEIVDFYVENEISYISIRAISPFGRAQKNWKDISYTTKEFIEFYELCMDYIIHINQTGEYKIKESFSQMILQKIYGKFSISYTDLNSPCGATIGQIAYNWNGNIYTCDEGRMMANKGIEEFKVGNVFTDNYKNCITSKASCLTCNASCIESNPNCSYCVFNPICGICPVYSLFTQNDLVGVPIKQDRCKILQGIYMYLIKWIYSDDLEKRKVSDAWGLGN